jgi:predicted PurR-regulated permease PerM
VRIAAVAAIFVLGQFFNDYVLTPNLVGDKSGSTRSGSSSPFAGGALLGFVGVVIAVPVSAAVGVLARFAIARYKESLLYRGHDTGDAC